MHYVGLNDSVLLLLGCYFSDTKDPVPSSDQTVWPSFCRSKQIDVFNKCWQMKLNHLCYWWRMPSAQTLQINCHKPSLCNICRQIYINVCVYWCMYVCMYDDRHARKSVCISHAWISKYVCIYVARHTIVYMSLVHECMNACISVHMYPCVHACVPSLIPMSLHIFDVTEQIWLPHCKYDPYSHYATWAYWPNFFHMCATSQPTVIYPLHAISMHGPVRNYASQYWEYHQEHWYTYISHNWHFLLIKYAYHIAHICPATLLL